MNWKTILVCGALALSPLGCDSDAGDEHQDTDGHETEGHDPEETEEITTVTLTFTSDTAETVTASFSDPDGAGGASGTTDPITLAPNTTYTLTLQLLDDLASEDITEEIRAEAEDHQFLFYGDIVSGPASMGSGLITQAYADVESDYTENAEGEDLPVGLVDTITTSDAGEGEFTVMLRHLPPINGSPQKVPGIAEDFAAGGTPPGETDVNVTFAVTIE